MNTLPPAAEIAHSLPDEPRWVDLRGLLLSERCDLFCDGDPEDGLIARSWDFPFAAMSGLPSEETVRRAVDGVDARGTQWGGETSSGDWHLLVPASEVGAVAERLPDWRWQGVTIHRWEGDLPQAAPAHPDGAEVRLAPDGAAAADFDFSHLPDALRHELSLDYVATQPMAATFVDGRPVAFCYAPYLTETLWDVAVDTLQAYRRRGLAAASFQALAWHLGRAGKTPVWGALANNVASMRMARRMGFESDVKLVSFIHPGGSDSASA